MVTTLKNTPQFVTIIKIRYLGLLKGWLPMATKRTTMATKRTTKNSQNTLPFRRTLAQNIILRLIIIIYLSQILTIKMSKQKDY